MSSFEDDEEDEEKLQLSPINNAKNLSFADDDFALQNENELSLSSEELELDIESEKQTNPFDLNKDVEEDKKNILENLFLNYHLLKKKQ